MEPNIKNFHRLKSILNRGLTNFLLKNKAKKREIDLPMTKASSTAIIP